MQNYREKKKYLIDYVLTNSTNGDTVKEIKIDEEKQYGLHKLEKNTAINQYIYIYIYIYAHIESILKHQQKNKGHRKKQQKNDIKIQNNHIRRKCK